jgi:hypothetical protein
MHHLVYASTGIQPGNTGQVIDCISQNELFGDKPVIISMGWASMIFSKACPVLRLKIEFFPIGWMVGFVPDSLPI